MSQIATQEKIFHAALQLFSDSSYLQVPMRDIAGAVGINVSSIYNHYPSKEALLEALYAYYDKQQRAAQPDMAELLLLAETQPPHTVLMRVDYRYGPEVQENMDRILLIAAQQPSHPRSIRFVKEHLLDLPYKTIAPLLERMIELGRIEPLDIGAFCSLLSFLSFGTATLNNTSCRIGSDQWSTILRMLFSLVVCKL